MRIQALAVAGLALLMAGPARAIGPEDVYLIVNKNVPESRAIAEHYCKKRGVPLDHILAFDLPATEDIVRPTYEKRLAEPLREQIKGRRDKVKVLLSIYGVPLRIGPEVPSDEEKAELEKVRQKLEPLQKKQAELQKAMAGLEEKAKKEPKGEAARELAEKKKERAALDGQVGALDERQRRLRHAESEAALDSELALLWQEKYELWRWQVNPLYFQVPEEARAGKPPVIMTARLDGPNVELIKRLVDQAIEVEKKGLSGTVYVDARGIKYKPKGHSGLGYEGYDESLREMARLLEKEGKMKVVLDDKGELFAPGSCPDCALYCGWYSHAKYVDCCRFVPGAVAYHIASSEAVSLRNPKVPFWCKNLLDNGVAATLGPVLEPYTIGFPKPAEFFGLLATGKYTLVECYWKTEMLASWMTVLVGDPLYNPYRKAPRLEEKQVKPSPEGAVFPFVKGRK
jgi:uncharacterized protein (TIGR03790 family)